MRSARANEVSDEHRKRLGRYEAYSSNQVHCCLRNRSHRRAMEALDALTAAERDIRALRTARADTGPLRRLHSLRSSRARLALPVRQEDVCGVGHRTFNVEMACATRFSWWTERARAAGGPKARGRLRGLYSRECGAVRVSEREYPAQRPPARATDGSPPCERGGTTREPAARGLSTLTDECGCGHDYAHSYRTGQGSRSSSDITADHIILHSNTIDSSEGATVTSPPTGSGATGFV